MHVSLFGVMFGRELRRGLPDRQDVVHIRAHPNDSRRGAVNGNGKHTMRPACTHPFVHTEISSSGGDESTNTRPATTCRGEYDDKKAFSIFVPQKTDGFPLVGPLARPMQVNETHITQR